MNSLAKGPATEGIIGSIVDGYAICDYLKSRPSFEQLKKDIAFDDVMATHALGRFDFLERLLVVLRFRDNDIAFNAFTRNVSCRFNMTEQSVIVAAYAPTSQGAGQVAQALVGIAEQFANLMNRRAREDWLNVVSNELSAAEQQLVATRTRITEWRARNATISPTANATIVNEQISKLEASLTAARTTYDQLLSLNAASPRRQSLEATMKILTAQIAEARGRLGGVNGSKDFATSVAEYEALQVDQESAEKHLQTIRETLALARIDTLKQQRYIISTMSPSRSGIIAYPEYLLVAGAGAGTGILLMVLISLLATIHVDGASRIRGRRSYRQ